MKLDTVLHKVGNQNRKTIWNFRDAQGCDKFYQLTQNDDQLLNVCRENENPFLKALNPAIRNGIKDQTFLCINVLRKREL